MPAIDAGAEDIALDDDVYEVITEPGDLERGAQALEQAGVEIESAELRCAPDDRVPVDEADARKLMRLIDALEESDDVNAVHANFDVDAAVLERIAGSRRQLVNSFFIRSLPSSARMKTSSKQSLPLLAAGRRRRHSPAAAAPRPGSRHRARPVGADATADHQCRPRPRPPTPPAARHPKPVVDRAQGPAPDQAGDQGPGHGDRPDRQRAGRRSRSTTSACSTRAARSSTPRGRPGSRPRSRSGRGVIQGWDKGIPGMKVGGRRELIIPAEPRVRAGGSPPTIPPNAPLVFVVDLLRSLLSLRRPSRGLASAGGTARGRRARYSGTARSMPLSRCLPANDQSNRRGQRRGPPGCRARSRGARPRSPGWPG